jgi:hypothetical protein
VKDLIADLEKADARQHNQMLRSPETTAQAAQLRQQIWRVQTCTRLNIFPALAWGGVAMVLAAAAAISEANRVIESDVGPPPSSPLATDIWGVGLLRPPN